MTRVRFLDTDEVTELPRWCLRRWVEPRCQFVVVLRLRRPRVVVVRQGKVCWSARPWAGLILRWRERR